MGSTETDSAATAVSRVSVRLGTRVSRREVRRSADIDILRLRLAVEVLGVRLQDHGPAAVLVTDASEAVLAARTGGALGHPVPLGVALGLEDQHHLGALVALPPAARVVLERARRGEPGVLGRARGGDGEGREAGQDPGQVDRCAGLREEGVGLVVCDAVVRVDEAVALDGEGAVARIAVLGESVLALITSTDEAWTAEAGVVALIGFVLLAALWWSYFEFGAASAELVLSAAQGREAYVLARDVAGFLHFFVTGAVICMAAGLATAVEEAGHDHLPKGAVIALAGGLALYHAAHAGIALRYGRPVRSVAVWALPGVGVPVLVVLFGEHLAPWLVVLLVAGEAVAHLLYARVLARRRRSAGTL
ncbi:low temperature requirement protein A [Streptomyces sp. NBC_00191]